jgi:hypothetical protein
VRPNEQKPTAAQIDAISRGVSLLIVASLVQLL